MANPTPQPWLSAVSYLMLLAEAWFGERPSVGQMEGQNATQTTYSGRATSWASRWWFTRCSHRCLIGATTTRRRYKWR